MAERTLAWLMEGDDEHDPDETAAIDAEHAALRAAQAAEPDHLDRSPAEIAAQAAQDAQMREHQAWFRQMRDFDNTNQKGPHK
jgi:DNA-directed RNA polymerase beta subunit